MPTSPTTVRRVVAIGAALLIFAALVGSGNLAGGPRTAGATVDVSEYSTTARYLAAQLRDTVELDGPLVARIDQALADIQALDPTIKIREKDEGFLTELVVSITDPHVADRWRRGRTSSGHAALDRLLRRYGPVEIEGGRYATNLFTIQLGRSVDIDAFASQLMQHSPVGVAERNQLIVGGCGGVPGGIAIVEDRAALKFVFARGSGDCRSGCIECTYTYFTEVGGTVRIVDELSTRNGPHIYHWNVPPRFAITVFEDLASLEAHFDHEDWWVRRHAVEVACSLLSMRHATSQAERGGWTGLLADARADRDALIDRVRTMLNDPEPSVADAARVALKKIDAAVTVLAAEAEAARAAEAERAARLAEHEARMERARRIARNRISTPPPDPRR